MRNFFYNIRNTLQYNTSRTGKIGMGVLAFLFIAVIVLVIVLLTKGKPLLDPSSITINPDATPISVQGYSEWVCNEFTFDIENSTTYGDLRQQILTTLDDWRTRRPSQNLLQHYINEKERLVALVNIFDENKDQEPIAQNSEGYISFVTQVRNINNHYANKRQQIVINTPTAVSYTHLTLPTICSV